LGDIFDDIAASSVGETSGYQPDIFDQIADESTRSDMTPAAAIAIQEATPELGIADRFIQGVKNTPRAIYDTAASIPSGISNVFNSVFSPKESLYNGTTEKTIRGTGALAAGLAGAGTGAAFGSVVPVVGTAIGGALGGAAGLLGYNKLNQLTGSDAPTTAAQDLGDLAENAGTGLGMGAVGKLTEVGLKSGASALNKAANAFDRRSLQTRASDYGKASDVRTIDTPEGGVETYNKSALNKLVTDDAFPMSRNPATLSKFMDEQGSGLAGKINQVISEYDSAGVKAVPQFENALNYLASGKVPADKVTAMLDYLDDFKDAITKEGGGKLSYMQQQKVALGKSYNPADAVKSGFDRAIYKDLKQTIETYAPEVKGLNQELAKYQVAEPIVNRSLKAAENATPLDSAVRLGFTTGGITGTTALSTMLTGNPLPGVAVGLAGKFLTTPTGQALLARGLRNTSGAADVAASVAPALGPIGQAVQSNNGVTDNEVFSSVFTPSGLSNWAVPPAEAQDFNQQDIFMTNPIDEIKADPYYHALAMTESTMNPNAKNPKSSAKGMFQFIDETAKAVNLQDPNDVDASFKAVKFLTDDHRRMFGNDPDMLYAAHVLGATRLRKVLNHQPLSDNDQRIVDKFYQIELPRFQKHYQSVVKV